MPTVGPREAKLIPLRGHDDHDRFIGNTVSELAAQRAYLLGRVIELETEALARDYRDGDMSERERRVCADELRSAWSRLAAGVGTDRDTYQQRIDLGRGDNQ